MSEDLRIAVAGVGAIGSVVGARLAAAGYRVTLVARGARAAQLRATGLSLQDQPPQYLPVAAAEDLQEQDVIFTAVKAAGLGPLIASLGQAIGPNTTLIPLVNGWQFWFDQDPIAPAGLVGAVVFITAAMSEDGTVEPRGRERLLLGGLDPVSTARVEAIAQALNRAGIDTAVRADVRPDVWSKMALNLATNPLSVVSGASLHEQFNDPELVVAVGAVLQEVIALARSQGVEPSMTLDDMLRVGRAAGPFYTSMFQDFEAGRPLELDAIGWRCLERGRQAGVPMPVAETLCRLCAFAEARRDRRAAP